MPLFAVAQASPWYGKDQDKAMLTGGPSRVSESDAIGLVTSGGSVAVVDAPDADKAVEIVAAEGRYPGKFVVFQVGVVEVDLRVV